MISHRAYYSLVQYCPDCFRAEAVNVGVVLFCPDPRFLGIRMTENHSRLRRLFGTSGHELAGLKLAERSIANRIATSKQEITSIDELRAFVATRANDLQLVEPRLVKITDASTDLERLFRELVEVDAVSAKSAAPEPAEVLPPALSEVFYRLSKEEKIWNPGKIAVPIRKRKLDVPYAYQNGVVNLVKPAVFGRRAETQAASLAIDGDLINRHPLDGEKHQLIVVSTQENEEQSREIDLHIEPLFKEYGVRLIRPSQAEAFASEVERNAH